MTILTLKRGKVIDALDQRLDDCLLFGVFCLRDLSGKLLELRVNRCVPVDLIGRIWVIEFVELKIFGKLCYFFIRDGIGIL